MISLYLWHLRKVLVFYRPEFSVFVGDLASDVDDFHLHQVFKKYPSCKGAKVVTDQYGYSRYGSGTQFNQADIFCVFTTVFKYILVGI